MTDTNGSGSSLTSLLCTIFDRASSTTTSAAVGLGPSTSANPADAAATTSEEDLLRLMQVARSRIASLSLISSNDTLEDLSTSALRAVVLDSVYADALTRARTTPGDFAARTQLLQQSLDVARGYLSRLLTLGVLLRRSSSEAPPYVVQLSSVAAKCVVSGEGEATKMAPFPKEAAARRQAKIAALRLERALGQALDAFRLPLRAKRAGKGTTPPESAYDLLVLPQRQGGGGGKDAGSGDEEDEEEEGDDEEEEEDRFVSSGGSEEFGEGVKTPTSMRNYLVLLLRLHALRTINHIDTTMAEVELLQNMPASAARDAASRAGQERNLRAQRSNGAGPGGKDDDWRIEQRFGASSSAPLLDNKGKPMRPFTILPAGSTAAMRQDGGGGLANDRQRLRDEVFRPSHRLPTMSIDEYLAEEQRRGNIIQGGGQASYDAPTSTEQRKARAEGEAGATTREADEAEEDQRRKDMEWDEFTEANPRGQGNTMNRG